MTSDFSLTRRLLKLLTKREQWRLAVSVVLILCGTGLELVSLGALIPVMQFVMRADVKEQFSWVPLGLSELSDLAFMAVVLAAVILVFLLKNLFSLASNYFQQRTQLDINNRLVQDLVTSYMAQPYEFHLVNSSSILVRNVQEFPSTVVSGVLSPFLTIFAELVTGIALLIALLILEPRGTLFLLLLLGGGGASIVLATRSHVRRWGAERVHHRGLLLKALMEGFGGIKEIKFFGRESTILEAHKYSLSHSTRPNYMFGLVQGIPRALMEVLVIAGVAFVILVPLINGSNLERTSLLVAVFGYVALRMLPSVNKIIWSLQNFSYGRRALEGAIEAFSLPRRVEVSDQQVNVSAVESIRFIDVSYSYPVARNWQFEVASLTITKGESVGVVGTSGSGKSTFVDLLLGILSPTSGQILVNGQDLSLARRSWMSRVGYVPQNIYLLDASLAKNIAFGLPNELIDSEKVSWAVRVANLDKFITELPLGLDTIVGERGVQLSGGQRQRLGIARALYQNPDVLVFDEATSALDEITEQQIVESIRSLSQGRTVIVVSHRNSSLRYCGRILRIEQGRISEDKNLN